MQVSRRELFRWSAGAVAGTALGGLIGCRADLSTAEKSARGLRIKDAKATRDARW